MGILQIPETLPSTPPPSPLRRGGINDVWRTRWRGGGAPAPSDHPKRKGRRQERRRGGADESPLPQRCVLPLPLPPPNDAHSFRIRYSAGFGTPLGFGGGGGSLPHPPHPQTAEWRTLRRHSGRRPPFRPPFPAVGEADGVPVWPHVVQCVSGLEAVNMVLNMVVNMV